MKYSFKMGALLFIFGVALPEFITDYYNYTHSNDFQFTLQYITGVMSWLSSLILICFSTISLSKNAKIQKLPNIILLVASVLFFIYITLALIMQYGFRHGVGL